MEHPYLRNTFLLRKVFHKGQLRSWHQSTAISAPAAGSRRGSRGHAQAWVEEVRKDIVGLINSTQVHGEAAPTPEGGKMTMESMAGEPPEGTGG